MNLGAWFAYGYGDAKHPAGNDGDSDGGEPRRGRTSSNNTPRLSSGSNNVSTSGKNKLRRNVWDSSSDSDNENEENGSTVSLMASLHLFPVSARESSRGHQAAVLSTRFGNVIVQFGGVRESSMNATAHMEGYVPATNETSGETVLERHILGGNRLPKPRRGHTVTPVPPRNVSVYVFGGTTAPLSRASRASELLGDVWRYTMDLGFEPFPFTSVSKPCPRTQHSAAVVAEQFYVFGGAGEIGYLSDLWWMSISTNHWFEVDPVGSARPCARRGHAMVVVRDTVLVMSGGETASGPLDDVWTFDTLSGYWCRLSVAIPPRSLHGMVVLPTQKDFNTSDDDGVDVNNALRVAIVGGMVREYPASSVIVVLRGERCSDRPSLIRVVLPLEPTFSALVGSVVLWGAAGEQQVLVVGKNVVRIDFSTSLKHQAALWILSKGVRYMDQFETLAREPQKKRLRDD
eukprot:PhM_4_TR16116/c0_g1_i4/m.88434